MILALLYFGASIVLLSYYYDANVKYMLFIYKRCDN
nr:MAG TPA: hypothetical protein [Caudoviricetes sp.]